MTNTRYAASLAVIPYFLALIAPALCLLYEDFGAASLFKLGLTIVLLGVWHLSFRNLYQSVAFSLPFFIFLPFEIFFFAVYHEPPTTSVLLSIGNTNFAEASDFMKGRVLILAVVIIATIAIWLQMLSVARKALWSKVWMFNPTVRLLSLAVLLVLGFACVGLASGPWFKSRAANSAGLDILAYQIEMADARVKSTLSRLKGVFPFGRLVSVAEYYRDSATFDFLKEIRNTTKLNASQLDIPAKRQIYVLVIGESARADHASHNGYSRPTSPEIAAQRNVIPISNMVSPWTLTALSVPTIVTGQASPANGAQLKSVISAFREAGFRTYWLSNQQHEDSIDNFAREADEAIFMNVSALVMERDGKYDGKMLSPFKNLLSKDEQRQFVVIHLLGSHDAYEKRYPHEFDLFQPSLKTAPNLDYHNVLNKIAVTNTYDNSMRYTDHVLSELIHILDDVHGVSALLYSSDHGETLFDGSCNRSGHGGSSRYEFGVNAFTWVSNEHKEYWPQKLEYLKARSSAPVTTEAIFTTMLGLAEIKIDKDLPQRNLVGAAFRPVARNVMGQEMVNWDLATFRGQCSLVTRADK